MRPVIISISALVGLLGLALALFVNSTVALWGCDASPEPPDGSFPMESKNRLTVIMPWISELNALGVSSGSAFVVATRKMKADNCTSLRWDLLAMSCKNSYKVFARASTFALCSSSILKEAVKFFARSVDFRKAFNEINYWKQGRAAGLEGCGV